MLGPGGITPKCTTSSDAWKLQAKAGRPLPILQCAKYFNLRAFALLSPMLISGPFAMCLSDSSVFFRSQPDVTSFSPSPTHPTAPLTESVTYQEALRATSPMYLGTCWFGPSPLLP